MMVLEAIRVFTVTIVAFLVALTVTPLVLNLLKKINAGKQIRASEAAPIYSQLHASKSGTPTMGGVIIWGTVLGLAATFAALNLVFDGFFRYLNFVDRAQTYLPLAALAIAAILGLADDILGVLKVGPKGGGLSVRYKLVVYTILAAVGAWWFYAPQNLDWHVFKVPFLGVFDIGLWYIPVFIFIIVASAFSANETDGLDGLLGGVSLFAFAALTVVAFALDRFHLATMGGAMVGALLAFLWYNIHPAKFFMGDTGSMALGITLGVMTMLTNTTLLLPFFGSILVLESLSVIIQLTSKKFFKKKVFLSTPIHHHFEALGWPESQVTMRFWIISVMFVALGLILFFVSRFFA
ncbi:MAG: phospho-N-acetylmuramoyl-pentapeptide-transferase [Candidatus Colwellbacteria bacterium CG_4_9_14_0_2_um_filter_50_12]|uniref:Phospho-N-acetylmuramoyl-pentapeptide-transferase n=1 Tax=Candidatus Colwellbacteria bacterium CG_4_9_14_0_2_um_filter_50_12 TaxID=1974538 RepID=A0A2M8G1B6_9BACT|nr:MAG: phospho-N-acetylmuramoyl-pentapeptide-transferase [Candidatus Colwellbacteria bacterium CG_4_9_14_0_2_um_filter_50_12]